MSIDISNFAIWLILVGALLSAISAFWIQGKNSKNNLSKMKVWLIFLGAILSAIGAFWASQNQTHFERELRQKNEEISRLTEVTLRTLTGDDVLLDCICH